MRAQRNSPINTNISRYDNKISSNVFSHIAPKWDSVTKLHLYVCVLHSSSLMLSYLNFDV